MRRLLFFVCAVFLLCSVPTVAFAQEPRYQFGDEAGGCDDEECPPVRSKPTSFWEAAPIFGIVFAIFVLPGIVGMVAQRIRRHREWQRYERDLKRFEQGEIDTVVSPDFRDD